ncbi:MAG: 30S ribosomal protein S12 methylthiotransferase RimO [Lachnospiraceae bacterium]|nr:30S ribosomal protein S12 methylthiotransferase RimO [Lachnospiraceae bacterium]
MKNKNVLFVSLGCDKNLVDTEKMLGILGKSGYSFTDEEENAEVIIINSCCFIGDAKEESIQTILEMARYRENGKLEALIVTGCLAERYRDEVLSELPEVDAVVGISAWHTIADVIGEVLERKGEKTESFLPNDTFYESETDRMLTTGGHYAHLKIAEGCNKHCTYCIIPSIRGPYRSVPMEQLVEEAKKLAQKGVRELILVAQETTVYGVDLYGKKMLPELLRQLCRISGLAWIRILYCYPEEITQELIDVMKEEKKICHYLDMPIQHASDHVLKRMGRRTTQEELRQIISHLRAEIPDIVLRTTLITGFPGETQEDFQQLKQFVDEMEFERLGVFPYSMEENTPAAQMEDQIDDAVKQARRDEIMELQQEISFAVEENCVDCVFTVMIEGKLSDENAYVGRTYMDAPGIDGYIFVQSEEELVSGTFVPVLVTGSDEYDLIGEIYYGEEITE